MKIELEDMKEFVCSIQDLRTIKPKEEETKRRLLRAAAILDEYELNHKSDILKVCYSNNDKK